MNARTIGYCMFRSIPRSQRREDYTDSNTDESWANTRSCESISPSQLNLNGFTHVNFGFGYFDPDTFQITPMVMSPDR